MFYFYVNKILIKKLELKHNLTQQALCANTM